MIVVRGWYIHIHIHVHTWDTCMAIGNRQYSEFEV